MSKASPWGDTTPTIFKTAEGQRFKINPDDDGYNKVVVATSGQGMTVLPSFLAIQAALRSNPTEIKIGAVSSESLADLADYDVSNGNVVMTTLHHRRRRHIPRHLLGRRRLSKGWRKHLREIKSRQGSN